MINNKFEKDYKKILRHILNKGFESENRTNVNTLKLFNESLTIDLQEGFPLITGKKMFFEKAFGEFLWMLSGSTRLEPLHKYNIKWWDEYATNGDVGKVYGHQIRAFNDSFDQWQYCIDEIKKSSRRAVISLWNPSDFEHQSLPCCFTQFVFYREGERLNMHVTLRSSDTFVGLPYDCAVLAMFLSRMASYTDLKAGELALNLVDAHIYKNNMPDTFLYLRQKIYDLPKLIIKDGRYQILNYEHGPFIKTKMNN